MDNKIQRPLIVEIEESKTELIQCINNIVQEHGLPCYILDMLLSDIVTQIKDGAKRELAMARTSMGAANAAPVDINEE